MTKIIADETLRIKLHNLAETLEICDTEGNVLGVFMPTDNNKELYSNVCLPEHLTREDIERRMRQGGGRPLAEIWKDLGQGNTAFLGCQMPKPN